MSARPDASARSPHLKRRDAMCRLSRERIPALLCKVFQHLKKLLINLIEVSLAYCVSALTLQADKENLNYAKQAAESSL